MERCSKSKSLWKNRAIQSLQFFLSLHWLVKYLSEFRRGRRFKRQVGFGQISGSVGGNGRGLGGKNQVLSDTHAYIIGQGFANLKKGDRFFYDHPPRSEFNIWSFPRPELKEIKKVNLAYLLCQNLEPVPERPLRELCCTTLAILSHTLGSISEVLRWPLRRHNAAGNPLVDCKKHIASTPRDYTKFAGICHRHGSICEQPIPPPPPPQPTG